MSIAERSCLFVKTYLNTSRLTVLTSQSRISVRSFRYRFPLAAACSARRCVTDAGVGSWASRLQLSHPQACFMRLESLPLIVRLDSDVRRS